MQKQTPQMQKSGSVKKSRTAERHLQGSRGSEATESDSSYLAPCRTAVLFWKRTLFCLCQKFVLGCPLICLFLIACEEHDTCEQQDEEHYATNVSEFATHINCAKQ